MPRKTSRLGSDRRFFFIHVMKTGGTSLWFQLAANFQPDEMFPSRELDRNMIAAYTSVEYLRDLPNSRRDRIRCYAAHLPFYVVDELGDDVATLTILRDPVERVLSHLKQIRASTPALEDRDLEEVYDQDPVVRSQQLDNLQVRFFALHAGDRPASFLADIEITSERLSEAKANLSRVDVVGFHDRYGEFLRELESRFGFRLPSVPDQRVSVHSAVSASLRRRIARDNAADIEFFEHARDVRRHRSPAGD